VIRSYAWSKGILSIEAAAASLYALTAETVFSALFGALVAGIPTGILLLKERSKDKAEERHFQVQDELGYSEMVSSLLTEKGQWVQKEALYLARIAELETWLP
jgi:hypothetical protein